MDYLEHQLHQPELDQRTASAAAVAIMRLTGIRVGNKASAARKDRPTRGASSLRVEDVRVGRKNITLTFPPKDTSRQPPGRRRSRKVFSVTIRPEDLPAESRELLRLLRPTLRRFMSKRKRGPLFRFEQSGRRVTLNEGHVSRTLAPFDGFNHVLRYLRADELLKQKLAKLPRPRSKQQIERNVDRAVAWVSKKLGHKDTTTTVDHYLDPRRIKRYKQKMKR